MYTDYPKGIAHPFPALWEAFYIGEGLHGIQPELLLLLVAVGAPKGSVHPRPGILQPLREARRLTARLRRNIGLLHGRDMMRSKSNETLLMDMHTVCIINSPDGLLPLFCIVTRTHSMHLKIKRLT